MNAAAHPLQHIAPGTVSLDAVTGASSEANSMVALGEIQRARAILGTFIAGITDQNADDRYVLWTVDAILRDAASIIEGL